MSEVGFLSLSLSIFFSKKSFFFLSHSIPFHWNTITYIYVCVCIILSPIAVSFISYFVKTFNSERERAIEIRILFFFSLTRISSLWFLLLLLQLFIIIFFYSPCTCWAFRFDSLYLLLKKKKIQQLQQFSSLSRINLFLTRVFHHHHHHDHHHRHLYGFDQFSSLNFYLLFVYELFFSFYYY